jgi:hypothetical protein
MNEEYGLSSNRMDQQLMIKKIVNNINPNFTVMFSDLEIQITTNNNDFRSFDGRYKQRLDLHKISECIDQLIEVEKELINSGIIINQFTKFDVEHSFFRLTFQINP